MKAAQPDMGFEKHLRANHFGLNHTE